jgi:threonine dehydratase
VQDRWVVSRTAPLAGSLAAAVDAAAARLEGVALPTPLQRNERLSDAAGVQVWLKREDLQVGRSYKLRGAYNLLAQLGPAERAAGAVCASAGNHGQGVAYACRRLGIRGRVHVPSTTPRQKRERIIALGGDAVELVVGGDTYDEAAAAAAEHATRTGATVVPAFDDPRTIAGQGQSARRSWRSSTTRRTSSWSRSAGAGCSPGWAASSPPGTRRSGSSGSSPRARRA